MSLLWKVTLPSTTGHITVNLSDVECPGTIRFAYDAANNNTAKSLALGWLSLLCDSPLGAVPREILLRFATRLSKDIFGVIKTYSSLADSLMKSERTDDAGCFVRTYIKGFERTPVYRVYSEWYRTGDPVLFRFLLSFLSFGKVAEFERPELEPEAFRQWVENEVRLKDVTLSRFAIENTKRVIAWLLDGATVERDKLCPHHGPGNVAERVGTGVDAKNKVMTISHRLRKYFAFLGSKFDVMHNASASLYPDFRGYFDFKDKPAFLTFVRKSYKALRTICMLPADMMYIGQGIREQFYAFFARCKINLFVDLTSQVHNQEAARIGSYSNRIDTIDLKNASDSVLWRLVKQSFPYSLLCDMMPLRTAEVQYGSEIFTLEKYAPMGDALCFPVQCILFSAIVIASGLSKSMGLDMQTELLPSCDIETLFNYTYSPSYKDPHSRFVYPRIFGDDICLDNRQTTNSMRDLQAMGFTVNEDKSFTGQDTFRESCGKFYTRGHDVSFIKYRKSFSRTGSLSIRRLAGIIDQANDAYDLGYTNLRRYFVQLALYSDVVGVQKTEAGKNPVLFSNNEDTGLAIKFDVSTRKENAHLKARWNPDLQRQEIQSVGIMPTDRTKRSSEYTQYEYIQWQARRWYDVDPVMVNGEAHCAPQNQSPDDDIAIFDASRARWYRYNDAPLMKRPVRADYRDVVPTERWTALW